MMSAPNPLGAIKPADLPAPPQEAIRVLRACADQAVTSAQLAKLVTNDSVLTAELLRIVNSAFFGIAGGVRTAAHAVTVLGQRALRNLVLCIAIRDALRPEAMPGFDVLGYWEDALRRAVAARRLAETLKFDKPDELFTAGLLQDFGLLAMFYARPQHIPRWLDFRDTDPEARYQLEQQHFGITHDQVGAMLAQAWSLPEELAVAMASHHATTTDALTAAQQRLCAVCLCADWMAAVYSAADKRNTLTRCRELLAERFTLDSDTVARLLEHISIDVSEAAVALGFQIKDQSAFEDILREANLRLVEENLSYQELTWRLEQTLAERDRLSAELQKDLELAREIQRSLLPKESLQLPAITGINIPAREVSGDFYDYFALPDGRIYFNLADVSGKGMNAALLMAKTSGLFHCLGKALHDPGKLLAYINNEICETAIRGMFITLIAGLYDPRSGRIRLANAGHLPALYRSRNGQFRDFPAQAPPLGILPDARFPENELLLDGGSLYLFSDGLTEAVQADRSRLELAGLMQLISQHTNLLPAARLAALVSDARQATPVLHDDITALLIEQPAA
jgi:phosphoserine phosphatase RsbU/P